jgi:hypothetical protein
MSKTPYEWSWEELEKHLEIFDRVEVNYFDGGEHRPFSGDSGISVLRVTDISPTKTADKKVVLHIATDSQWFTSERMRIMPDSYIEGIIKDLKLDADIEDRALKAFRIGVPPLEEPHIGAQS